MYKKINPKQSFPDLEKEIVKFWDENNTFEKSIENRKDAPEFNFYDGPPFATGTPHYWHILAGTIKDVIPRYQTMKWKLVNRVFGWDCHGLPIENIVEKKMEISGKDDIMKVWIHDFNESCRANVSGYVDVWKNTVKRMWRWVDMENSYKTMDTNFMESVWWVYKSLYDKGLIYEGHRVVPYCPRCTTPLSNFEVNQGYKDKQDKTLTVKFKVKWNDNKYILAWTTTPWTLMANLGLAVWADITYVELSDKKTGETYILAKDRLADYYKNESDYSIVREYLGTCLEWIKYEPIFDDFKIKLEDLSEDLGSSIKLWKNVYSVIIGHHVTTESWTWIVHIAPAYWEDDFIIWEKNDLGFASHIDDSWKVSNTLSNDWEYVFDYNEKVIEELKNRWDIVKISTIDHSYPHCWRCDTPLIYRWISAWYVAVEKIRDKMITNNQKVNWVPGAIKNWRFGKWLEWARDWNISRNRYWGSAIPVWQSEDKKQEVCIWSIEEMYELNKDFGQIEKKDDKYFYTNTSQEVDIHKHFVDEIFLVNKNNFKAKNVLWVHWMTSDINKESWQKRIKIFKEKWFNFDLFQFDKTEDPTYESWEETFKTIDFSKYDTVFTNSYWWNATVKFLFDNSIKVKRLVMTVPWISINTENWKYVNTQKLWESLENKDLTKVADEIIIIHAKDDEVVPFKNWKKFAEQVWANLIELNNGWHGLKKHYELMAWIIKYWTPLKRIPEVLDCWFESWAMPYASKHYPFAEEINPKVKKATIDEEFEKIDEFFGKMWKEEFGLDRFGQIEKYKAGRCFYLEENWEIISCLYSFESKKFWKEYIWRLGTKKEFRGKWLASDLIKTLFTELYNNWNPEIAINAEIWNENFYEFFGFVVKWKPEKMKEDEEMLSIYMEKEIKKEDIYNFKFPADFIAEWLDQTRGWFYTLLILGTALFDNTPFLNVIVNWIILAEDGKKMSKSLKNYPDPTIVFDKYGADALRFYLMNSVVVEAQEFRFSEIWVAEVVKKVILPLWNTYYFYTTYANIDKFEAKWLPKNLANPLDKWLISELNILIKDVSDWFDNYRLNNATRPIVKFMDNLTNWYIRRSRKRFWKTENDGDKIEAYETLNYVLIELSKIISPFMPFVSESIFKNLTQKESVHLENFPEFNENLVDEKLSFDMKQTQNFITLWLSARANAKLRVRQPLAYAKIWSELEDYYKEILKEELNVKEIKVFSPEEMPKKICKPNGRTIWPKFWKDVKFIMTEAKSGNFEELENGNVKVWEFELEVWDFEIVLESRADNKNSNEIMESAFGTAVAIHSELTPELISEWIARDLVRQIQEARKEANFNVEDRIKISITWENIKNILEKFWKYIEKETLSKIVEKTENPDLEKEVEIENLKINLTLKK